MMSTGVGDPNEYAGYRVAVRVLEQAGGVLMPGDAARALALLVLHATGPHVRAELLADISDDLAELSGRATSEGGRNALSEVSYALDLASHQLRTTLEVGP